MRYLGGLERQFHQQNLAASTHIAGMLAVNGRPDPARLASAWKALARRYPLLACEVRLSPLPHYSKESREEPNPIQFHTRDNSESWRRVMERGFQERLGQGRGLVSMHVVASDSASEVLFIAHHAFADGYAGRLLCESFIDLYNGADDAPAPDLGPMEERFPARYRGFFGVLRAIRFVFTLMRKGPALQIGRHVATIETESAGLRFERADELAELAKTRGANLFALLSAVVLKSFHKLYGTQETEAMSLNTPVSLRNAVNAHPRELGVFIAGQLALYRVSETTDIWQLAHACHQNVRNGIALGQPFLMTLLAGGSKKPKAPELGAPSKHRPSISLSNLGALPEFAQLGELEVYDYWMAGAQSIKDPFGFVVLSYRGHLNISLQISRERLGSGSAQPILDEINRRLNEVLAELA